MLREIIVKTLIGKGKYESYETKQITLPEPASKTLGCWIINHQFETEESKKCVVLKGKFDVQLWYATNHDQKTNVYNETVSFFGPCQMAWKKLKTVDEDIFLHVHVIQYPTATAMTLLDEHTVEIKIRSAYIIDAYANAAIQVESKGEEEEESEIDEEIVMNVNPNYLEEKK